MLSGGKRLAYKPYKKMTVEDHIFKLEILLELVLVDECGFEFAFLAEIELLHLYLLSEIHTVLRHSLIDSLLCAPVDRELLVLLLIIHDDEEVGIDIESLDRDFSAVEKKALSEDEISIPTSSSSWMMMAT